MIERIIAALQVIAAIGFFGMGLVQFFAIVDGVQLWFGVSGFMSYIIAGFITYFPLVGVAFGVGGAVYAWHWQWHWAALLFGWPLVLGLLILIILLFASPDEYVASAERGDTAR